MDCNVRCLTSDVKRLFTNVSLTYTPEYIETELTKLKNNITNIFYNNTLAHSYQDLYTLVENLCTLNMDNDLYKDLAILVTEFLNLQLIDLNQYEGNLFLHKLKELWLLYCYKSKLIKNIYIYLEASSFRKSKRTLSIWNMCMAVFQTIILSDEGIKIKLKHVYNLIEDERNGKQIDCKLINDIITMYDKLGMYTSYFEEEYLIKSKTYYIDNSSILLKGDILMYFYYVQSKLLEEEMRVSKYLKPETEHKIINIIYNVLLETPLDDIITSLDADDIFDKGDLNDLTVIYELLVILPKSNKNLCQIFGNYIEKKGTVLIYDIKNESNLIGYILEFKDRIDEIVHDCFKDDEAYKESVRSCFKKFINQRKYKPAQFLAKFIDNRMRDKLISEELLDKIMVLFRYIHGKDVFEAYYKRYLSKRLLLGKSSSQDAEKYMISKLKLECGDGFTSKLEGMFRDIDMSESLTAAFKQKHTSNMTIDFSAHILTSSFWPTFTKYSVTLSDKMLQYQTIYHDFYKAKYSGRSLQWIPSLGSCLIKAYLKNGMKEFQVSLFQALVMLLFNETNTLTYKTMKLYLNLEDYELLRTVLSLSCGKTKILIKQPVGIEVKDSDQFTINENFTNKLFRIKINQLQYKDTEEEQKITEEEVLHDRHLQIDAALVRLMKQSKKMRHNDLISKIYTVLKFPLNPNDIKKRIEILIERDFLVRNPEDSNSYLYVA